MRGPILIKMHFSKIRIFEQLFDMLNVKSGRKLAKIGAFNKNVAILTLISMLSLQTCQL